MVRKLIIIDYGVLNSLLSLLMIISLPVGALQILVTKFVAQFKGQGRLNQVHYFLTYLGKRVFIIGVFCLGLFFVISPFIADFLKITSVYLVMIVGVVLFISVLIPLPAGTILGLQRFVALSIYGIVTPALKLILSIFLVTIGFRVFGALGGVLLANIFGFVLALSLIPKEIFHLKADVLPKIDFRPVYKFLLPAAISNFCYMTLTNSDVVLVKHFFTPTQAGYYSVAQMVGKIILFLPAAVVFVIFPKMVDVFHSRKQKVASFLKRGLVLAGLLSGGASIFCIGFPALVLKVLTNKDCADCVGYVPFFCIAMTFYALVQILFAYFLATEKYKFVAFLVFGCALQILLITLFHQSLTQVLYAMMFNSALLFTLGMSKVNWKG